MLDGIEAALAGGATDPAVVTIEAHRYADLAWPWVVPLDHGLTRFERAAASRRLRAAADRRRGRDRADNAA